MYERVSDYARNLYKGFIGKVRQLIEFSPLELAIAGAPNQLATTNKSNENIPLSSTYYNQGIRSYASDGNNVNVYVTNGETITLHPRSVRHDSISYIRQVLINKGVSLENSKLKKLAKLLDGLRKKK